MYVTYIQGGWPHSRDWAIWPHEEGQQGYSTATKIRRYQEGPNPSGLPPSRVSVASSCNCAMRHLWNFTMVAHGAGSQGAELEGKGGGCCHVRRERGREIAVTQERSCVLEKEEVLMHLHFLFSFS